MGQNSSRSRGPPQNVAQSDLPSGSATSDRDAMPGSSHTADSPASAAVSPTAGQSRRRSTVRKSFLNLVKQRPSSSSLHEGDSTPSSTRRSWRQSRRWSKTPLDSSQAVNTSQSASASSAAASPLVGPKPRESEQLETTMEHADRPSTPFPQPTEVAPESDRLTPDEQEASQNLGSWLGGQTSTQPPSGEAAPSVEDEVVISPEEFSDPTTDVPPPSEPTVAPPPLPPSSPSPPQQQSPPSRAFPPPGTLVVVQGVVHTTDVPRSDRLAPESTPSSEPTAHTDTISQQRATSTPRPASPEGTERSSARNRLSALLRSRPSSMASARPPSSSGENGVGSSSTIAPSSSSPLSNATSSEGLSESSSATTANAASTPAIELETSPSANNMRSPISSSSIDVLGTLLSVAAAATAASLLTGSSEPMLSSGLNSAVSAPSSSSTIPSPSTNNNSNSPPNILSPSRPTSPTPTAGLTAADSAASILGRTERMRQAWGSIRERLGLRPSNNNNHNNNSNSAFSPSSSGRLGGETVDPPSADVPVRAEGAPVDARERMLAEMARAFNLGLGLTGDAFGGQSGANSTSNANASGAANADGSTGGVGGDASAQQQRQTPADIPLPPEGSFERFLVDLQADLRIALTQNVSRDDSAEDASNAPRATAGPEHPEMSDLTDLLGTGEPAPPSSSEESAEDMPGLQANSDSEDESEDEDDDDAFDDEEDDRDTVTTASDMPNLATSDIPPPIARPGNSQNTSSAPAPSSSVPTGEADEGWALPSLPSNASGSRPAAPGSENASGRINWWRLYRFPPIAAPHTHTAAAADTASMTTLTSTNTAASSSATTASPLSTSSTADSVASDPSSPSASTSSPPTSPESMSTPSAAAPVNPPRPNIVIPVIVVGLQSVNMNWRQDAPTAAAAASAGASASPPTTDADPLDIFGAGDLDSDSPTDAASAHASHSQSQSPLQDGEAVDVSAGAGSALGGMRPDTPRGRRWHARAATALRNLRPGRRAAEQGAPEVDGTGSRTFLIYVIGGYYPPDHSIVTGEPNNLDSFEALLDLAELLGQVKPPTVSKEEIDKSGLEVIKSTQIAEHEQAGKIANNCTERCLICLDDYQDEEDVRVLTCRHAFHKNCVDKWLQTGKNNCPACRSKGVSDGVPAEAPLPPAMAPADV